MTMYYEFASKKILSLDDLKAYYADIIADGDTLLESFDEYLESSLEWRDFIELDKYDIEKLESEKCYFCKDSDMIWTRSELKHDYDHDAFCDHDDFESFDEWLSAQCAPWESLFEMN